MQEIEKIYENFKSGKLSEKEAGYKLVERIFVRKKEFNLHHMDEDTFSEFMIFELTHISKVFHTYNSESGSFASYVYGSLQIAQVYWTRKKIQESLETQYTSQIGPSLYEEKLSLYNDTEDNQKQKIEALCEKAELENLKMILKKIENTFKDKESMKEAILILMVKSCHFINEELISRISILTSINENELEKLIAEGKKEIQTKLKRIEKIKSRRDNAYYFRNRYMMQKGRYENSQSWICLVNKKFEKQNQRWENTLKELSVCEQYLSPSNIATARILNTNERRVAYIIKKITTNIDTHSLPWYSLPHEDLPCKQ